MSGLELILGRLLMKQKETNVKFSENRAFSFPLKRLVVPAKEEV